MEFHFVTTPESEAFFRRKPIFYEAWEDLLLLSNSVFGRSWKPTTRVEQVGFNLGQACRVDFLEITFLATNGCGPGALKVLRGFYERAVALAYMIKHPEKAERFVRFGAIQEYKMVVAALEHFSEQAIDDALAGNTTVAQVSQQRQAVKAEFQVEVCSNCHRTGTAFSWDVHGVLQQAQDVGGVLPGLYLTCYAIPNLYVHTSPLSAFHGHDKTDEERLKENRHDADIALLGAGALILSVFRSQDELFHLGVQGEVKRCEERWLSVWAESSEGSPDDSGTAP